MLPTLAMAQPVTVSLRLEGRAPYAMFEVVELTATTARLRSALMLEIGELVALRVARGERTVDVEGRVASLSRGDGDPVATLELVEGGSALASLLG